MIDNLDLKWSYSISKNGHTLKSIRPRKCHSFTANFGKFIYNMLGGNCRVTATDTGNTSRDIVYIANDAVNAGISNDNYGIQVGTGTNAPTINDYALQTKITTGSSSGKLQYGACTVGSPSSTSTTATFRVARVFTNSSGGTITVEEIGLILYIYKYGPSPTGDMYFLIIRDVTGGVAVANGQALTINYDLTTTI